MVQGVSSVSKWYKGYLESANGTRSVLSTRGYLESAKATGGILSQQRLQGYLESARGIGVF